MAPRLTETKDHPKVNSLARSVDSKSEVNPHVVWHGWPSSPCSAYKVPGTPFHGTPTLVGRQPGLTVARQRVLWLEAFKQQERDTL